MGPTHSCNYPSVFCTMNSGRSHCRGRCGMVSIPTTQARADSDVLGACTLVGAQVSLHTSSRSNGAFVVVVVLLLLLVTVVVLIVMLVLVIVSFLFSFCF